MKNLKIKINIIFLTFLLSSYFVTPFIGLNVNNNNNDSINRVEVDGNQSTQTEANKIDIEEYSSEKSPIYDKLLSDFLSERNLQDESNSENIKIIIMFKDDIEKKERLNLINSIFDDYQIINNYDIIPGTYLECNSNELILKQDAINTVVNIQKIYKSNVLENPIITEGLPKTGALSTSGYPNWWVPAISGDNLPYNGSGVRVAVIDSGIYHHPDLNIVEEKNFVSDDNTVGDLNGHGTHCAGIIGSRGADSGRYGGVASGVDIINARAANADGDQNSGDVISALEWSYNTSEGNADIICLSIGGGYPTTNDPLSRAISKVVDNGTICVVSAGNNGPNYFSGGSPASSADAISVGATDINNNLASFSSWGPAFSYLGYPDIVAPGVNIISTEASGGAISSELRYIGDYFNFAGNADYIPLSGTSMAAPMVAGALAILKEAYPNITPETARIALIEGAKKLSNDIEANFLKSGAGLINISASLDFLENLDNLYGDINKTVKVFPDDLPVKPYDLLHYPGDHQRFNLTIISGKASTYDIQTPNNQDGVMFSTDKQQVIFSDEGVNFTAIDIKIGNNVKPGIKTFRLNITSITEPNLNATVNITLDIRLPEYRVLMESYHGINDCFPESSFPQIGFYEAMADMSEMNISIDYGMDYWIPDYDSDLNNSLLTEEKLAQYDLVVLQSPILPYCPLELNNLKKYYDNGGNILFLGTRYNDLCRDNVNALFSKLGVAVSINTDSIASASLKGAFDDLYDVRTMSATPTGTSSIINGVTKFIWNYGSSFSIAGNVESIASINGRTVAAAYNGSSLGKGRFVAFGDLHWIFEDYNSTNYYKDHEQLLTNLMEYLLPKDEISINIGLSSIRTASSALNITVYVKNRTSDQRINSLTLNNLINVSIENEDRAFFDTIDMNSPEAGISLNTTFNLPFTSNLTYTIKVNITLDGRTYNQTSKILYYNHLHVPKIISLSVSEQNVLRRGGYSLILNATLNDGNCDVDAYLSPYSGSFDSSKQTTNKTLTLVQVGNSNNYSNSFNPSDTDPSGNAAFYILPINVSSYYFNPNSPRVFFEILNDDPAISILDSEFNTVEHDETFFQSLGQYYSVCPDDDFRFKVTVSDTTDSVSNLRVFVSFYISLIEPNSQSVTEMIYQSYSAKHEGTVFIPANLLYDSISGTKSISTLTDVLANGYIGILCVTVFDTDGDSNYFLIYIDIAEEEDEDEDEETTGEFSVYLLLIIAVVSIICAICIIIFAVYKDKGKQTSR